MTAESRSVLTLVSVLPPDRADCRPAGAPPLAAGRLAEYRSAGRRRCLECRRRVRPLQSDRPTSSPPPALWAEPAATGGVAAPSQGRCSAGVFVCVVCQRTRDTAMFWLNFRRRKNREKRLAAKVSTEQCPGRAGPGGEGRGVAISCSARPAEVLILHCTMRVAREAGADRAASARSRLCGIPADSTMPELCLVRWSVGSG